VKAGTYEWPTFTIGLWDTSDRPKIEMISEYILNGKVA
jgi:hypothetical protein